MNTGFFEPYLLDLIAACGAIHRAIRTNFSTVFRVRPIDVHFFVFYCVVLFSLLSGLLTSGVDGVLSLPELLLLELPLSVEVLSDVFGVWLVEGSPEEASLEDELSWLEESSLEEES